MICLLQRVSRAEVSVAGETRGRIGTGLLIFVCAEPADRPETVRRLADRIPKLRVFADGDGRMNRSALDLGAGLLAVSQFTLAADLSGGNRPSFSGAAAPGPGRELYQIFVDRLAGCGLPLATGTFGADMAVSLVNDGPASFILRG